MRRAAAIVALLLLAGCAAAYQPITIQIDDERQYNRDKAVCDQAALAYTPHISASGVGYGAVEGGAGALSYAPINPLIPVLGAAGGAGRALADGLGTTGRARRNVAKHCLEDLIRRDGSAIVANPDD